MTEIKNLLGINGPIIDVHCHVMCFQYPEPGKKISGFMNAKFLNSVQAKAYKKGLGIKSNDPMEASEEFIEKLIRDIEGSSMDHVVILPLDGVYTEDGVMDYNRTIWTVDNDFVFELCKRSPKMLPGCSINPLRRDWKEELDKCVERGSALIKWLPNVMGFCPGINFMRDDLFDYHSQLLDFYEAVVDHNLPILSHAGFEFALPIIDSSYSDLYHLEIPLSMGVKMIIPHFGGGRPVWDSRKSFNELLEMRRRFSDNIYFDCSGMCAPHRKHRFHKAVKNEEIMSKTLYGTDYPILVQGWAFMEKLMKAGLWDLFRKTTNSFDKDLILKYAMGLRDKDFGRGYQVINFN